MALHTGRWDIAICGVVAWIILNQVHRFLMIQKKAEELEKMSKLVGMNLPPQIQEQLTKLRSKKIWDFRI
jgi:hypothetical protein